jgi:6-hydroxy-3-succinoylpyridine 3-monooxygenase
MRTIVYIDGFNLYYGAIRSGPNKWLNLEAFFKRLRADDQIQCIYYFTALVDGDGRDRQNTYLRALATLPIVTIVLGRYKLKQVTCSVTGCSYTGLRRFKVPEEKRTDVNIAVQMLDDAYQDRCDRFILVSGDSDLVPAVARVKTNFPKKQIVVYVPARDPIRGAAVELRGSADKHRNLPLDLLPRSQFPASVPDGSGGFITKPPTW